MEGPGASVQSSTHSAERVCQATGNDWKKRNSPASRWRRSTTSTPRASQYGWSVESGRRGRRGGDLVANRQGIRQRFQERATEIKKDRTDRRGCPWVATRRRNRRVARGGSGAGRGTRTARRFKYREGGTPNRPWLPGSSTVQHFVEPGVDTRPGSDGVNMDAPVNHAVDRPVPSSDLQAPVSGPTPPRVVKILNIQIRCRSGRVGC